MHFLVHSMGIGMKTSLVFIHGLLGSLDYYRPATFLGDFSVFCPSLIGYGPGASPVSDTLSLNDQVASILEQASARELQRFWLVGHSVGGAIAMLLAEAAPDRVDGIINIEGNFTLEDAFWSQRIATMDPAAWDREYRQMQSDPSTWLANAGIQATSQRLDWAQQILTYQGAATVRAMARAVVDATGEANYLDSVRFVLSREMPLYLYAGQNTVGDWHVPEFVRRKARGIHIQANVGHMMMLEDPEVFCDSLARIVRNHRPGGIRKP